MKKIMFVFMTFFALTTHNAQAGTSVQSPEDLFDKKTSWGFSCTSFWETFQEWSKYSVDGVKPEWMLEKNLEDQENKYQAAETILGEEGIAVHERTFTEDEIKDKHAWVKAFWEMLQEYSEYSLASDLPNIDENEED